MTRAVKETFTLSGSTVLPKDAIIGVATATQMDPQIYPEPEKFDPYRFATLRTSKARTASGALSRRARSISDSVTAPIAALVVGLLLISSRFCLLN
jgi:Cytochrome P450